MRDAADHLRAVLARVKSDGEWAAGLSGVRGAGAEARRRMIEAGEMGAGCLTRPIGSTGWRQCAARATQTASLRSSLVQVVGERDAAAEEHSAYRDEREAKIVNLKQGMTILQARCRAPEAEPAADAGKDGDGSVAHGAPAAAPAAPPAAAGDGDPAAGASREKELG